MLWKVEENKENVLVELPAQMCCWHNRCCIFKMKLFVLVRFCFGFCSFIVEAKFYWFLTFLFYFLFLPYFRFFLSFPAHVFFFSVLIFPVPLFQWSMRTGNVCCVWMRISCKKGRNFQGTDCLFLTHLCQLPSTPVYFSKKLLILAIMHVKIAFMFYRGQGASSTLVLASRSFEKLNSWEIESTCEPSCDTSEPRTGWAC